MSDSCKLIYTNTQAEPHYNVTFAISNIPPAARWLSENSLLPSLWNEFKAVQPVPNPFGFHFTVCNFLRMPLDQQLSILYLKSARIIWHLGWMRLIRYSDYLEQSHATFYIMLHYRFSNGSQVVSDCAMPVHCGMCSSPHILGQKGSSQGGYCFNSLGMCNITARSQMHHSVALIIP